MIDVKDLKVTYTTDDSHYDALKGVTFNVDKGEIFTIMGLSGSGKSTLVRSLIRLVPNIRGKIICNDKDVLSMNNKQLIDYRRHDVSMVFQNYGLLPHLTVTDNVIYGLRVRRYTKKEAIELSQYYINLVGLSDWKNSFITSLSGGMKQRVGIARALVNQTPILLMDEPFSGLDPITRLDLQKEILKIRDQLSITIVFVTHSPVEAHHISDRIMIIKDGLSLVQGTYDEIQEFGRKGDNEEKKYVNRLLNSEESGKLEY